MAQRNSMGAGSIMSSFRDMSLLTAFALAMFTFASAVQLGLAQEIINWLTQYQFAGLAATFMALALIFASSNTRDPRYYNPVEWTLVVLFGLLSVSYTMLAEIQSLVANFEPWSQVVMFALYLGAAAVVSR